MRNFKNTFVILLVLSLFSCSTQSVMEDEAPMLSSPASSLFEEVIVTPPNKKDLTMNISVIYPEGWDKAAMRAQIGPLLGLQSWTTCLVRGEDVEIWTISGFITEAQFITILGGFQVTVKSVGSLGTVEPYDTEPYSQDSEVPVFVYYDLCQQ